jgi:gamma-glutamyltranspeptidase / glutathione hydrolase
MSGMAVAPQVPAAEAAYTVLRNGGNAIDAAVTGAFVQMIVDPQNAGIAGFGAATVRQADGTLETIDFNGTAGSRVTPGMWESILIEQDWTGYGYHLEGAVNDIGYQSIMTPGTVAGLAELLKRHGTWEWSKTIEPAIRTAADGFVVTGPLWTLWNMPSLLKRPSMFDRIQATEASKRIYFKNDRDTWAPGERLKNPDYARSLERLASNGPDEFYTGKLADEMVADLEANGGFVTGDDLAGYRPRVEEPICVRYRGYEVHTNGPAGGGICMATILNILEHEQIDALGHNSTEYIYLVARAMQAGYSDWYGKVGDPAFVDVPVADILSKQNAANWYERIKNGEQIQVPVRREPPNTTHITVADNDGNVVALTHSLGSSSGVVTPGLGFTYNNIMNAADPIPGGPNSIAPGKSRITGMAPTIVQKDGKPVLALGAPGGTRIITGVLQALLNVIDHGMSPQEAVDAARFDAQSEILDCEARIPSWRKTELAERGFTINPNAAPYGNFARVQAITMDPVSGEMRGGSDPRGGGAVIAG